MKRILIVVSVICVFLVGCVGLPKTQRVNQCMIKNKLVTLGMSTNEVKDLIGPPDKVSVFDESMVLGANAPAKSILWIYGDLKVDGFSIGFMDGTITTIDHYSK